MFCGCVNWGGGVLWMCELGVVSCGCVNWVWCPVDV